jgi:hypothetical protein
VLNAMLLKEVYKGIYKTNDPNNWRGVCLKEFTFKVISSIISTRLLAVLAGNSIEEKFASSGRQQAMHSLRSALRLKSTRHRDMCDLC